MAVSSTRERILQAAEELISEKGISRTTIAQIARRAEVADSLAYQYFKGKEDLVFAVADQRLEDAWTQLQDQLQGIDDVPSLLSTVIRFGLQYNDQHRDYVRNLMFAYRSNKEFYSSPAYQVVRRHADQTLRILERGVDEGIFHDDVNMKLVRDLIYGTFDFEAVSCVITGEIEESSSDCQDILTLLFAMVERRDSPPSSDKRLRILDCAEKIFADRGFNKATVSEIAGRAGVAEGSIYDFFKNKEDLLLSIAGERLKDQIELLQETFHVQHPIRKLRRFIRFHFDMYLRNRDFLQVFVLENLLNNRFYSSGAFETFRAEYLTVVEGIVEEGKELGVFRKDVNTRVFRNMFLGAFTHMALRWIVFQGENCDKMREIDGLVDLLCAAVSSKAHPGGDMPGANRKNI